MDVTEFVERVSRAARGGPRAGSAGRGSARRPTAVVAVGLALLLLGAGPVAGPAEAQQAALTGRVVDADSGEPVSGASVRLEERGRGQLTDDGGRFRIEGLEPGPFRLAVERIGFVTARREGELAPGEERTVVVELAVRAVRSGELVVTATRTETRAGDVASSVSVLSEQEVDANPARTSSDLLRSATSVNLPRQSSTVSHPTGQSVSIRGTGGNRTLVMLDGIPLNDAFGGWVRWTLAPKSLVDRVEVLRGGGSSLFGTYAMGGVVQLFTKEPEGTELQMRGSLGERDLAHGQLFASHASDEWAVSLAGSVESGGGFVAIAREDRGPVDRRSSSERRNVTTRVEFTPSDDESYWMLAGVSDEDRNSGTALQTNQRTIGSLALGTELGREETGRFEAKLFGSLHRFGNRNSQTFGGRARESLTREQDVPVEDVGASLLWTRALGDAVELSVGGDLRYIVGENQETRFDDQGDVSTRFDTGGRQVIGGLLGQAVITPDDRWRVELSLRADSWHSFDAFRDEAGEPREALPGQDARELSPRVGLRFHAGDEVTLRGAAYRTFRAPTLNELFRGFFTSNLSFEPNPRLQPETLRGGEAGVDWRPVPSLSLRSTVFWNRIENRVDFVFQGTSGGRGLLRRQNIGQTRLRGAEAEVAWRPVDRLRLTGNYTFIDSEILESTNPEDVGNEASEVPTDQASLQAVWEGPHLGRLGVVARYVGQEFEDEANTVPLDEHVVVGVDWERDLYRGVGLFVAAENLFDERVLVSGRNGITELGMPQTIRAGLSYDLSGG